MPASRLAYAVARPFAVTNCGLTATVAGVVGANAQTMIKAANATRAPIISKSISVPPLCLDRFALGVRQDSPDVTESDEGNQTTQNFDSHPVAPSSPVLPSLAGRFVNGTSTHARCPCRNCLNLAPQFLCRLAKGPCLVEDSKPPSSTKPRLIRSRRRRPLRRGPMRQAPGALLQA